MPLGNRFTSDVEVIVTESCFQSKNKQYYYILLIYINLATKICFSMRVQKLIESPVMMHRNIVYHALNVLCI